MPTKVLLTGNKLKNKIYYHHTGYIGGIKERTAGEIMRGKFPERVVEKAVERMLPRGPLGQHQLVQSARLCRRRASARGAAAREARHRGDESQEHQLPQNEGSLTMAEEVQSFGDLKSTLIKAKPAERRKGAGGAAQSKRDAKGRAYATGRRKNAVARVWIKPGLGRITVNGKEENIYFARPVLRMILRQPLIAANRDGQFDVIVHGHGRRTVGTGGRGAPRHFARAGRL